MRVNVSFPPMFYLLLHTDLGTQDPEIQQKTGKTNPVDVMAALREMKNAM